MPKGAITIYNVSNEFLEAIEGTTVHHIRGELTDVSGGTTEITDSLTGNISTNSQCVTNSGQFGFGGMYVGTLECSLNLPYSMKDELKGGTITLEFGAEVSSGVEWIPLGVWNIDDCLRDSNDRIKITGKDNLHRLLVDTEPAKLEFVGVVKIYQLMQHVTALTGVEFAQTAAELETLSGISLGDVWSTRYGKTAWEEVRSIAQFLGCFAFANRGGKIEFRRLDNTAPVLTIGADRRFKAQLEEYTYSVRGVKLTDSLGYSKTKLIDGADSSGAVVGFSDCMLVWELGEEQDDQYTYYLDNIIPNIKNVSFTPGTVDYYGNPALDVGDYVTISGGLANYSGDVSFLICCNSWQFRGPQTLTACGFSETGTDGMTADSKESRQIRQVNISKSVKTIKAITFPGEVFISERNLAQINFSCRDQTACFAECSLVASGTETGLVRLRIYVDDVLQTFQPIFTLHDGEYSVQSFSLPLNASASTHNVRIAAVGTGYIEQIEAFVWGQNITEIYPEPTDSEDYTYKVEDNQAEIIYYNGDSRYPEIPSEIDDTPVTAIAATAFSYCDLVTVYIPDGVTEIG